MGFINGINCALLLLVPLILAAHNARLSGRAISAALIACLIAVVARAASPVPDVLRPWLPTEVCLMALLLNSPKLRRSSVFSGTTFEERRSAVSIGFAIGRFIFESLAPLWAALSVPGFTWEGLGAAASFPIFLVAAHGAVRLVTSRQGQTARVILGALAGHIVFTAVWSQYNAAVMAFSSLL